MKLECKLRRVGGTDVDLPPDTVQFRPLDATRADSPHVADVTTEQAQRLIAADPRVYVLFDEKAPRATLAPPSPPPPAGKEPPAALYGSSTLPAQIDLGAGRIVTLGDVVRAAFDVSLLTIDEWNSLSEDDRDARLNALIAAASTPPVTPETTATQTGTDTGDAGGDAKNPDTNGDGALSVRELKAGIADGSLSQERIRELMAQEEASAEPRSSFIAECVKALK